MSPVLQFVIGISEISSCSGEDVHSLGVYPRLVQPPLLHAVRQCLHVDPSRGKLPLEHLDLGLPVWGSRLSMVAGIPAPPSLVTGASTAVHLRRGRGRRVRELALVDLLPPLLHFPPPFLEPGKVIEEFPLGVLVHRDVGGLVPLAGAAGELLVLLRAREGAGLEEAARAGVDGGVLAAYLAELRGGGLLVRHDGEAVRSIDEV